MAETATRFPLAWPMHWKRTPPGERRRATFRRTVDDVVTDRAGVKTKVKREVALTIAAALDRLQDELIRLGATGELLSSNVPVGLKGLPLSSQTEPRDPGIAVYFELKGKPICMASDRWDRVADNVAAIAAHIDALRRIDRYGVGRVEQAFAGYAALPPAAEDWRLVLGVDEFATLAQVDAAFMELARRAHPDAGGNHDDMAKLTAARDFARKVLTGA